MKGRAFHRVIGESSVAVFRDGVWVKPWHVMVYSPGGKGHLFFWTRRNAVRWAEWISNVIGDAVAKPGD